MSSPPIPSEPVTRPPTRRAVDPPQRFDVAELPPEIADKAFASGNFPYGSKLEAKLYDAELPKLQIELVKMLDWVKREGERVVVVFEGRDAAGKGGVIQRSTEHLNPRFARIVALPQPTETETRQGYFQRYVAHLPPRGEMAIFDRSWYNRATVEPVFGYCTPQESATFLREAPILEAMLARDGIRIVKFFLSIGREMQIARLHARWHDPLRRWKLSDIDFAAIEKWDDYSAAFEAMLIATDTAAAPWTVVLANDKRRARLETIRHLLDVVPYAHKDPETSRRPDQRIILSAATFLGTGGEVEG
jgi:polyphosphate kinase 2